MTDAEKEAVALLPRITGDRWVVQLQAFIQDVLDKTTPV